MKYAFIYFPHNREPRLEWQIHMPSKAGAVIILFHHASFHPQCYLVIQDGCWSSNNCF